VFTFFGTNCVHILHDSCELESSVFAFLLILICLHSSLLLCWDNILHDLYAGTQYDCFLHDSFMLEHSDFGYL
jgi:hypothetical protein